jgi:hypothetical protein
VFSMRCGPVQKHDRHERVHELHSRGVLERDCGERVYELSGWCLFTRRSLELYAVSDLPGLSGEYILHGGGVYSMPR